MNSNFRNFAIWVIIILLLVALFNLFKKPGADERQANEVAYSEFLNNVEAKTVADVSIKGNRLSGTLEDGSRFNTYAPRDPNLVASLRKSGVKIEVRPAEDKVPSIFGMLVS